MAFGLEIFDSSENTTFSTTDTTWTMLGVYTSSANTSTTHTGVPIMPTRLVTRTMVDQVTGDDEAYVHTYSLSGSTLTTTAPDTSNTVETLFTVFGK